VDVALRAGALGARMTSGGFGGAIIALIDRDSTAVLTQAAEQAFADAGMPPPRAQAVTPSPGARKEG
jgi:galactokinase